MDSTQMTYLLSDILECGTADLSVLSDVKYEWSDVIEVAEEFSERITLKSLFNATVRIGLSDLESSIEERIEELQDLRGSEDEELEEDLEEELKSLKKLDVNEDFETFFNFIDTHVYLQKNKEIYDEYLSEEIELFEENTGFNVDD